jgi:sugar phosphate isomerase/epimerase
VAAYSKGVFLNVKRFDPRAWDRDLEVIAGLPGRSHLEVWLEHLPASPSQRQALRARLAGQTLIVHGPFIDLDLASPTRALAERSRRTVTLAIELASDLGAKVVTLHAGYRPPNEPQAVTLERLVGRLAPLISSGAGTLSVTVENLPAGAGTTRQCLATTADLLALRTLLPQAMFTLDIGHCLQNGDDYLAFLAGHWEAVGDIHLHDGHRGGQGHLRLGAGELDLAGLVRVLAATGYDCYVSLETLGWDDTRSSWQTWRQHDGDGRSQHPNRR